ALPGQSCAQAGVDANHCFNGNFRRGALNRQIKREVSGIVTVSLPGEAIDSATAGQHSPGLPCPDLLFALPASHAPVRSEESVDDDAGLFNCHLEVIGVAREPEPKITPKFTAWPFDVPPYGLAARGQTRRASA